MSFGRVGYPPCPARPDAYRTHTSEHCMKVQEDPTKALDLPATHFHCLQDSETFSLQEYGYGSEDNPVKNIDGIACPNADEDDDHPIVLQHISAEPKASPDGKKNDLVLAGNPWENLSEFDEDHYDYGDKVFSYDLEDDWS